MPAGIASPGTLSTLGTALAAEAVAVGPNVATCDAAEGDTEERGEGSRVSERLEQMERRREGDVPSSRLVAGVEVGVVDRERDRETERAATGE